MFDKIVLLGYSGHGFVVTDAAIASGMKVSFYSDREVCTRNPFDLTYIGFDGAPGFIGWNEDYQFILGIGDNRIRNELALKFFLKKKALLNVFHPSASISAHTQIGVGNFISRNSTVNTLSAIGNYCILNTGCIVEHECRIGNAVHIAPGAVLAGNVEVGDCSFIGANAVIKQGVKIGSNVVIGAGTVVLKDVEDNKKLVGNPGRVL